MNVCFSLNDCDCHPDIRLLLARIQLVNFGTVRLGGCIKDAKPYMIIPCMEAFFL